MRRALAIAFLLAALPPTAQAQPDAGTGPGTGPGTGTAAGTGTGTGTAPGPGTASPPPPLPDAHRPEVEVRVEPAEGLHTGDLVTLTIVARAVSGDDVAVPGTSFEGRAHVELLDTRVEATPTDDGYTTFVLTAELLATDPGTEELGPVQLRVVTADGVMGFVDTDPVTLHIASLLADEPNAEPKPPTEPVAVLEEDDTLLWVLGIAAAMLAGALLALLVARWWSRRERPEPPPPPPRPPWEIAMEKLAAQADARTEMIRTGRGAAWVDGVSDAVREYLGRRYGFDGLERTTDEILRELRKFTLAGITLEEIQLLLSDYDLIKFAKEEVDVDQAEGLLAAAYRIVRSTSPRSPSPAEAVSSSPEGAPPAGATNRPEEEPAVEAETGSVDDAEGGPR